MGGSVAVIFEGRGYFGGVGLEHEARGDVDGVGCYPLYRLGRESL